jgi:hypothetical protein
VVCHGKNPVDCVKVTAGKLFSKSVDGTVGRARPGERQDGHDVEG